MDNTLEPKPFHAANDTAPAYWMLDILWTILATGADTGGRYCVLEQVMPGDASPPPHIHPFSVEVFYLLDGAITYTVAGATLEARQGSLVVVPRNNVHSFKVTSESAHVLNFYLPAGWEQVFPDLTRRAERRELPPKGLDEVHSANVTRFLNNYWGNIADVSYAAQSLAPTFGHERPAPNPTIPAAPLAVNREDVPALTHDGAVWKVLADATAIGGLLSVAEVSCPSPLNLPLQTRDADTAIYVVAGQLQGAMGGAPFTANAGTLLCLPAGTKFSVAADIGAQFLFFSAPGREVGA